MDMFIGRQHTGNESLLLTDGLTPYSYYEIQVSVIGGRRNSTATTYVLTDEDSKFTTTTIDTRLYD